jgi:hypothetical protein
MGRVTGQLAGAAKWAGEPATDCLALGVAAVGAPVVQLVTMIAAAAARRSPARLMPSLSAAEGGLGRAAAAVLRGM